MCTYTQIQYRHTYTQKHNFQFADLYSPTRLNKIFIFYDYAVTWAQAQQVCRSQATELATITDATELTIVTNTFTAYEMWIGLNDLANEGTLVWADGDSSTYRAWAPGEPNNSGGNEDCVQMVHDYSFGVSWNDNRCDKNTKFLCEQITSNVTVGRLVVFYVVAQICIIKALAPRENITVLILC
jgi:hypothetical protein